jgi:hypothetical protein
VSSESVIAITDGDILPALELTTKGKGQKPEARRQRAEARSQKPEGKGQKPEARRNAFVVCPRLKGVRVSSQEWADQMTRMGEVLVMKILFS